MVPFEIFISTISSNCLILFITYIYFSELKRVRFSNEKTCDIKTVYKSCVNPLGWQLPIFLSLNISLKSNNVSQCIIRQWKVILIKKSILHIFRTSHNFLEFKKVLLSGNILSLDNFGNQIFFSTSKSRRSWRKHKVWVLQT